MEISPTRYRRRPPEVDALEVVPDTAAAVLAWLREHGRDAYVGTAGVIHVMPTSTVPGFDVPFGLMLVRDEAGRWAPVPRPQLESEFVSVRDLERAAERAATGAHRRGRR